MKPFVCIMKDGTYQLVREYQVLQDRVKYLSTERAEWEEMPLELVDLNRTKQEAAEQEDQVKQEAKEDAEERRRCGEDKPASQLTSRTTPALTMFMATTRSAEAGRNRITKTRSEPF